MFSPIDGFLALQPALIMDGALATELERRGADLSDPLWSAKLLLEDPALIHAVHRDYFIAGADLATTATYQATFAGFLRRGLDQEPAARLMQGAVALALGARDEFWSEAANRVGRRRPLVAASVGPYGAMLADGSEYRGRYAVGDQQLREFHAPRLAVLARSGADLLACETMPCLREAVVLAELLRGFPGMTAWMSFACRDGARNVEGEDVAVCAAALQPFDQVAAIGVNCTAPGYVSGLLQRMSTATDKPLLAYPNSGEHYSSDIKAWTGDADAAPFADRAVEWLAVGARLIGGCCRTTPADIHAIRAAVLGPPR
jgi:homocysteine S-methyltransferase